MYQKEIIYMGLYKEGSRLGSAGFLKVENRERGSRLHLKIQNIPLNISGRFPIRVHNGNGWKEINGIVVKDGGGSWEEDQAETSAGMVVQVMLPGEYYLEGRSKTAVETTVQEKPDVGREPVAADEENTAPKEDVVKDTIVVKEERVEKKKPYPESILIKEELPNRVTQNLFPVPQNAPEYSIKEDKWEQILDTYENIHPYGDERVYVKLEPKDFVILQSKYQHLVNNSFLLHGFYNYRYIILGKEQDYYLGVPGVFYEREKMVALMFGFEAFECPGGDVKAGEFGYYLRRVEL